MVSTTYQREVCETQTDELIEEFDMQQDLPRYGVVCLPYLFEMHERVNSSEKSTVEPPSPL